VTAQALGWLGVKGPGTSLRALVMSLSCYGALEIVGLLLLGHDMGDLKIVD